LLTTTSALPITGSVTSCYLLLDRAYQGKTRETLCPAETPRLLFFVNFSIATALREREVDHAACSAPLAPA
jgi:hypothetical protein